MSETRKSMIVEIGANISKLQKSLELAEKSIQRLGTKLTDIGTKLTAFFTISLTGAGAASVKLAGNMEQSQIAFETLLGSAEKADTFLKQMFEFASKTPFEFVGLQDTAKRMMALGFQAEQIIPMLTSIGNAAAGLGGSAELIDRITTALGQMQAKGKVSAQEMNQLAEGGIPAWDMLAKKIGMSIPEAMKAAENGAISASVAIPAILEGMNSRFAGMMDRQSTTLLGLWSTFKDNLAGILIKLGEDIEKAFNLKDTIGALNNELKELSDWWAHLDESTKKAILTLGGIAGILGPAIFAIGLLVKAINGLIGLFWLLTTPVGLVTTAIIGLTAAWMAFKRATDKPISEDIADVTKALEELRKQRDALNKNPMVPFEAIQNIDREIKALEEKLSKLQEKYTRDFISEGSREGREGASPLKVEPASKPADDPISDEVANKRLNAHLDTLELIARAQDDFDIKEQMLAGVKMARIDAEIKDVIEKETQKNNVLLELRLNRAKHEKEIEEDAAKAAEKGRQQEAKGYKIVKDANEEYSKNAVAGRKQEVLGHKIVADAIDEYKKKQIEAAASSANALSSFASIFANKHKGMFNLMKLANAGEAMMNTFVAYTAALKIPGPAGWAQAAAVLAAGMAKVVSIKEMSFGGGGGRGGHSGGGSGGGRHGGGAGDNFGSPSQNSRADRQPQYTIIVQGDLVDMSELTQRIDVEMKRLEGRKI